MALDEILASEKCAKVIATCNEMLDGSLHLVDGVRRLSSLSDDETRRSQPAFLVIRAIESDADAFPIGASRAQCAPDYLKEADAELEQYLDRVRGELLAACREIVQSYA